MGDFEMNVQIVHDHDNDEVAEDNVGGFPPGGDCAFVVDGCSEPYFGEPFRGYPGGISGGQLIGRIVQQVFSYPRQDDSLEDFLLRVNGRVWREQKQHRKDEVQIDDAATLANASFSCLKVHDTSKIEVIWGADVFTLFETQSGKVRIFGGDNREADMQREMAYAKLVASVKGDPEKEKEAKRHYWLSVSPEFKRQHDNVLYATLNGQPNVSKLWHKELILEPVKTIVLVSDGGWIPMEMWDQNPLRAEEFIWRMKSGGLVSSLQWVRSIQNQGLTNQRVKRSEAVALAITF